MTTNENGEFPDGFLWGTATASYQVEGAVHADGRGPSIWDTFSHTPGKTRHGDTGDVACDQYNRVAGDVELMGELGIGGYRFSIAWPRIQPNGTGPANQAGLDYYRRLVDLLRAREIEPAVTLYHWDLPQALQDAGGWENRDTADRFAELADIVSNAIGGEVGLWITLNEPWVSSFMGYGTGQHAPGITDAAAAVRAAHHLLVGHGKAVDVLRSNLPEEARVGITLNLSPVHAASDAADDLAAAIRVDGFLNRWFLDPLLKASYPEDLVAHYASFGAEIPLESGDLEIASRAIDFLGINYYTRRTISALDGPDPSFARLGVLDSPSPDLARTDKEWTIEPEGLTEILVRVHDEYGGLPLYVTENGAAFGDYVDPTGEVRDVERVEFLESHFRAALAAIEQGVDLKGYFVWSLLDNFEWADGYSMRFGIVHVDYGTQARIAKQSAYWYAKVIEANGLV